MLSKWDRRQRLCECRGGGGEDLGEMGQQSKGISPGLEMFVL